MLTILALALSANLDNLGVGVAYGIGRISVAPLPNAIIAAIALLFTSAAGLAGDFLARMLPDWAVRLIGFAGLLGVGVYLILAALKQRRERLHGHAAVAQLASATCKSADSARRPPGWLEILARPEKADLDASRSINISESFLLGIALSINCLVNGLAAPWLGAPILLTAVITAVFSYLTLWGGAVLGRMRWSQHLGDWGGVAAGLLLLALAVKQLF